jgi:hypothetical protein
MKQKRFDMQPALGNLASVICAYDETDGFCSPSNKDVCRCWDRAEQLLHGSGMSCQALEYVLLNKTEIEKKAAEDR